jgi:hypothetical protein
MTKLFVSSVIALATLLATALPASAQTAPNKWLSMDTFQIEITRKGEASPFTRFEVPVKKDTLVLNMLGQSPCVKGAVPFTIETKDDKLTVTLKHEVSFCEQVRYTFGNDDTGIVEISKDKGQNWTKVTSTAKFVP